MNGAIPHSSGPLQTSGTGITPQRHWKVYWLLHSLGPLTLLLVSHAQRQLTP